MEKTRGKRETVHENEFYAGTGYELKLAFSRLTKL